MNRRFFVMSSAGTLRLRARAGANDTVRIACVGVRAQGALHIRSYLGMPGVEIAALCDVDESVLDQQLAMIEKSGKKRPARYVDFRELLEDKTIDAVSLATPNHWHTLQTIWACQAGKDVYVEKPCSHNLFEARQIVAAAKKYNRIVQHGTNARSLPGVREAVKQLREGVIGDVYMARGLCFRWRESIGRTPPSPVPDGVHYNLWLGPAPKREFTRNRFHYNWHWFWDYGNGDIGNQGTHQLDVARWGLGVSYPAKVSAMGGHLLFDDDQETPNTLMATFEFEKPQKKKQLLVFDVRPWITNREAGIGGETRGPNTTGVIFYGSSGYLVVDNSGMCRTFLGKEQQPGPSFTGRASNYANFIDAVRSRKPEDRNAPVEEGAISTALVHLANISYRVGRTLNFDVARYECIGDAEANRMFSRHYREPFVVPARI